MSKELKKGDKVTWNTSQGETSGTVVKKQTSETHINRHKVAASADHPEFIVKSDKSGKEAAHEADALTKTS